MSVNISLFIYFQRPHKANIQTSIVIKIKLICHIINGCRSDHCSKCLTRNRESSDSTGFHRQCHHIKHTAFSCIP